MEESKLVYAPELEVELPVMYDSSILCLLAFLFFMFAFGMIFSPNRHKVLSDGLEIAKKKNNFGTYEKVIQVLCIGYIFWIFMSIFLISPIGEYPLFSGMHRRIFAVNYGNKFFYKVFFKSMTYVSLILGASQFVFLSNLKWKKITTWFPLLSWSGAVVLLLLMGHRFSSLVWIFYLFIFPLSLLLVTSFKRAVVKILALLGCIFGVISVVMFLHNFLVGGFHRNEEGSYLKRRLLVDQGQMWNIHSAKVFGRGENDTVLGRKVILEEPLTDKIFNSGAQLLMYKQLGSQAHINWDIGHMIAVGFPTNLLYVLGGDFFLVGIFLLSLVFAYFVYLFFFHLGRGNYLHCLGVILLMNPFAYLLLGGTAQAVFSFKYLVKVLAYFIFIFINRKINFEKMLEMFIKKVFLGLKITSFK